MNFQTEIKYLDKHIALYEEIIFAIAPSKIGYSELTSVIGPILQLNLDTAKSIKLLADNNHLRDLIILSRPFIECAINIGFICTKGEEAIIKSKKYAYQKGYRDLFKGLKINEFEIKSSFADHKELVDEHRPDNLIDALDDYTTAKGKEVNAWTDETTKKKLEILAARYGIGVTGYLSFAFHTIYSDVSEIIHGSYYGVKIFLGMQQKDITDFKSSEEAAKYFTDHQFKLATLILQQISITIASIIEILEQEFKSVDTLKDIKQRSKDTLNLYTDEVSSSQNSD